jgi:hypothetical protein
MLAARHDPGVFRALDLGRSEGVPRSLAVLQVGTSSADMTVRWPLDTWPDEGRSAWHKGLSP